MSAGLVMPFWHQPRPIHSRWARVKKKVSAMQLHCLLLFWVLYSNNLKSNSCPHAGCTCDGTAPRILADEGRAWVHRDLFRSLLLAGKSASMSGSDDEDLADQFLIGFEDGVTCLIVISIFMSPNVYDIYYIYSPKCSYYLICCIFLRWTHMATSADWFIRKHWGWISRSSSTTGSGDQRQGSKTWSFSCKQLRVHQTDIIILHTNIETHYTQIRHAQVRRM